MKRFVTVTLLSFLLAVFAAALPARADDVDQRIRTLESELSRLKTEQAQVKAEQIELKKNALAAEGALPTFSYRSGNGLLIEAADKAWGIRFSMESHMRMEFESGHQHAGRTNGEIMGRRFRPRWNFCILNCLYEIETSLDLDGFGTNSGIQRGVVWVHLENFTPVLPTLYFGMDGPASMNEFEQGSSSAGSQMDYALLRRNGFNTGSSSQILGLNWDDKPLDGIGIPGRISRINLAMGGIGEAGDGQSSFRDAGHNFVGFMSVQPFSQVKSKWLSGIGVSGGVNMCNIDTFTGHAGGLQPGETVPANGCATLQVRDNGDGGRQTLFSTATTAAGAPPGGIGRGWAFVYSPGFQWQIGPYTLRATGTFENFKNGQNERASITTGKTTGRNWNIGHDLFIWSPQGILTGSAATPGSVLFGTHFERTDVTCNGGNGGGRDFGKSGCTGLQFNRNTILLREWDLWYFVANRVSVGVHVLWYDAANIPSPARYNLGMQSKLNTSAKGGNWVDMNLNFRYTF
jgi:hypothetical protein